MEVSNTVIYADFDKAQLYHSMATCIAHSHQNTPTPEQLEKAQHCYFESECEYPLYKVLRNDKLAEFAKRLFPERSGTKFGDSSRQAMSELIAIRSEMLVTDTGVDVNREIDQPDSLLLFRWAHSLFDRAGTPASLGFIDDEYFAPWDTWLTLVQGKTASEDCLLSWVPPWARSLVQAAMWASPTECLSWGSWRAGVIQLLPPRQLTKNR